MPGIKGMIRSSESKKIRRNIWRSMRIMRRFTQPDILRTVPGATVSNVRQYLNLLVRHSYIAKVGKYTGGRTGECQCYQLVRDIGPDHPNRCDRCGQSLTAKECKTKEEREKEKERETEKEKEPVEEVTHDAA